MADDERRAEIALHEDLAVVQSLKNAHGHIAHAYAAIDGPLRTPEHRRRAVRETLDAVDWIRRALEHMENMMADDERRAEIEAVVRELKNNDECGPGPVSEEEYRADAEAILAAIDRVRDARGDDEAGRELTEQELDAMRGREDPEVAAALPAARSPQGEDDEAVEAALDAIEGYAQALTDQRGWGATRRAICENAQKVRTYLSHVSPSRDGTVAVEDVLLLADRIWAGGEAITEYGLACRDIAQMIRAEFSRPEQPEPDALGGQNKEE